jgi:hypothetical protein
LLSGTKKNSLQQDSLAWVQAWQSVPATGVA